jgi:hypothetical protein
MDAEEESRDNARRTFARGPLQAPEASLQEESRKGRRPPDTVDRVSVFGELSDAAEDEGDSDENEKSRANKQKEKENLALRHLYKQIESQWPIDVMDIWEQCLERVETIGLVTLSAWCRDGCLDPGPFSSGDGEEAQLPKAMVSLHKYVVPGLRGRLQWDVNACKAKLYDINLLSRKYHQSERGKVAFVGKEYGLR